MRITVVGPGAVGLLFAMRLAQAGADVNLLDHRPDRAAELDQRGVLLETPEAEDLHLPLKVSADPAQALAGVELALVCVKAYQTAAVAPVLAMHLPAGARALTLQNGAGNVETLAGALGVGRVLGGITSEGATLLGPGLVRHAGRGETFLGAAAGPIGPFCQKVVDLFNAAGFVTQAAQGVQNLIWTKLVVNVGINALTAIFRVPNGRLVEVAPAAELMAAAVEEALAVGRALGICFLHQDMPAAVAAVARRTANNRSSMLQDVSNRRRTEVEFINGAVVEAGRAVGVATPVNQTLTRLVLALEQGLG
ncbi:MAG: ketopantoate reductase family protein [Pseudomonadota bacterium]